MINKKDFYEIIYNADEKKLNQLGFKIWDSMNNLIKENNESCNKRDLPIEELLYDEIVYLFPKCWYDIIPDGFKVINVFGETKTFQKGESDDDNRYGCLPYGFKRKIKN